MPTSNEAKQNVWVEHYERPLNVDFEWDPELHLPMNRRSIAQSVASLVADPGVRSLIHTLVGIDDRILSAEISSFQ